MVAQPEPIKVDPAAAKKALIALEREIARLDDGVQKAVMVLGDFEYGTPEYERVLEKYERLKEQLEEQQQAWEEAYAALHVD